MAKKGNKKDTKKGLNTEKVEKVMEGVEEMVEDMNQIKETKEDLVTDMKEIIENDIKEIENMKKIILNRNIKGAIYASKGLGKRGITGKQYKSILDGYKRIVQEDMSEEQCTYIKSLTDAQGKEVITVINAYARYIRNEQVFNATN